MTGREADEVNIVISVLMMLVLRTGRGWEWTSTWMWLVTSTGASAGDVDGVSDEGIVGDMDRAGGRDRDRVLVMRLMTWMGMGW